MAGLMVPMQPGGGLGGASALVTAIPVSQMIQEEKAQAQLAQQQPVIQGLAGHVKRCFESANIAKRQTMEERLLQCVRQRRGEYDPDVLNEIRKGGGSEIYMMLTSNKCRAAASWIKDVLFGTKDQSPWDVEPTAEPTLAPDAVQFVIQQATQEAIQMEQELGQQIITPDRMRDLTQRIHDRMITDMKDQADKQMKLMKSKMEDQLEEGGFYEAIGQFIDDLVTFPFAVIKGPVPRKTKQLQWVPRQGQPPALPAPQVGGMQGSSLPPSAQQPPGGLPNASAAPASPPTPPQQPAATPPPAPSSAGPAGPLPMSAPPPVNTGAPQPAPMAGQMAQQFDLVVKDVIQLNWDRIDPFMLYWAPHATCVEDGFVIERHKLTRTDLLSLKDVDGYNNDAIDAVLDEYGKGGLRDWLYIDYAKAEAEGKSQAAVYWNPEQTIDALQFWGSVQGKMLIEWGMDEASIPDPLQDYPCEVWTIGAWCIKAVLNSDPLGRKPYFKTSYEVVPGAWAGNGVADLVRDTQSMCNYAARALSNNMGISSGPQMYINVDRLPGGEDITQMYPWRIWQTTSDPYGNTADPVKFFQPTSNAQELMAIFDNFSQLADEYSGIPRYMQGDVPGGGLGRTASGISMLMSNAGKSIKHVISNIDFDIIEPLINRLYFYNMKYSSDPSVKGDVRVVARGVNMLVAQEATQQRMNEVLNIVASNPMFVQIVGEEAIADLLREVCKPLNMDIVPDKEVIRARILQQQQMQMMQMMQQQQQPQRALSIQRDPRGAVTGMQVHNGGGHRGKPPVVGKNAPDPVTGAKVMPGNSQRLASGASVTDIFAPQRRV